MPKFSTGLRDNMLDTSSFKSQMDGGKLHIYSGTPPATADAALSGNTLLCTLSEDGGGTGLTFDAAADGAIPKAAAEVWKGVIVATGTSSFFRFTSAADGTAGTLSTTYPRVQGTISTINADMVVANTAFVDNDTNELTLNFFAVALPTD
jgi:hypothetical protein